LREDDARVAARAHQGAIGRPLDDLARVRGAGVTRLTQSGVERHAHIGAGIAVGNGKHVERVDGGAMAFQPRYAYGEMKSK